MTGQELTDRLISDINNVIRAKTKARTTDELLNNMSAGLLNSDSRGNSRNEEMTIAMSYQMSIPDELGVISQFINHNEKLVNFSKGDNINIEQYLAELIENREKVISTFQIILDNKSLGTFDGHLTTPLSETLIERLNYLHRDASIADNCYNRIIGKK